MIFHAKIYEVSYPDEGGYRYDDVQTIKFRIADLGKLQALTVGLPENQDVALTSEVNASSFGNAFGPLHIPIVDFSTEVPNYTSVISEIDWKDFRFAHSGRSFHGYGLDLLNPENWSRFQGKLLGVYPEIVDDLWVGHCLRRGYGGLRWTCNSYHYKKVPELLDIKFKDFTVDPGPAPVPLRDLRD